MELRKMTAKGRTRFLRLYHEAFPRDERAPDWLMLRGIRRGKADAWDLMDGDVWVGFAYAVTDGTLVYLFFLAVDPAFRGQGYGHEAIAGIREKYPDRKLFLALEPLDPSAGNAAERIRRHDFYLSCGLRDLPYRLEEGRMIYSLMGTDDVSPEEYARLIGGYLGWLRAFVPMRFID